MRNTRHSLLTITSTVALGLVSLSITSLNAKQEQKVVQTFAFFGCNRIDQQDYEATKSVNPSSANLPQLKQNLADIATLAPNTVFFGGDLVMGYADDQGEVLKEQMSAWIEVVKSAPHAKGSQYVAMPGNHEVNRKHKDQKLPNAATTSVWAKLVRDANLVPSDAHGPTMSSVPQDNLVDDQSKLSFSFDRDTVHYVVLNTDTRVSTKDAETGETKIGMIPTHWLDRDLDQAEKNTKIKQVIIMGHRNVVDPTTAKGDAPIDVECAKPMVESLKKHKKVRAYICAHVHAFDITAIGKKGLLQVCFGNGGSKLEKGWKPSEGRTFGFGYFKAYADGSLGVIPYLRPEPKNYLEASPELVPPAKPQSEQIIPVR